MTALSRSARWAALEAVWCEAAAASARHPLGSVPWQSLGSCGSRTDLPWIGEPDEIGPWDAESMRSVCRACPVLADCAAYVQDANVSAGWWAGTHRDPTYIEPARPGWVPVRTRRSCVDAQQGLLPLPLAPAGGDAA
ncbi:WhiB family transcriptional regulator [Terrabacter sp. GCM10028922]|uniref:WhiB family transcriptional regulator n=1 Tax=Terrabacter sp. GCM10028922 TaxID=3273428 RepID=UPI003616BC61